MCFKINFFSILNLESISAATIRCGGKNSRSLGPTGVLGFGNLVKGADSSIYKDKLLKLDANNYYYYYSTWPVKPGLLCVCVWEEKLYLSSLTNF